MLAKLNRNLRLYLSANDPVNRTIMAKEVLNAGPAMRLYFESLKPGIDTPMLYLGSSLFPSALK
jgi:hypothetical protein